ncbi:MFS transporter [Elioraea sp.]|uniref:MFS transporter n=1 Tax=Elioraea sp. TaxID=2185103 RepID=UPI003F7086FB
MALLGLPLNVYLPAFWGEVMGLGLTTVGTVLLATRLLDGVTDPLIGWLSDRTRTGFGRRRPWIAAAVPIAAPAVWLLFVPPSGAGALHLFVAASLVYLGWTMVNVPYSAWGAELSRDYNERTRITSWREAATIAGIVASAVVPAVVSGGIAADLRALAITMLALSVPAFIGLFTLVPEPVAPGRGGERRTLREFLEPLRRNRPFLRLLAAWIVNGIANGLPAALFLLIATHLLDAEARSGLLLLVYFVTGVAAVPFWGWLARRTSKHRAWCASMLWAAAAFAFVPLLGPGDWMAFLIICVLTGASLGADLALPPAMQADVIDLDHAESGSPRAGLFFAAWSMAQKGGNALAVGVGLPLLEVLGFRTGPAGVQGLGALVGLYAVTPIALKLVAVALMWRFPLDRDAQAAIRARLERRG